MSSNSYFLYLNIGNDYFISCMGVFFSYFFLTNFYFFDLALTSEESLSELLPEESDDEL